MKKIALVLLAVAFFGYFIVNASEIKLKNIIKNRNSIEQLDIQTTTLYTKLLNEVKTESRIDQNTQNSFNKIIKEFNKNNSDNQLSTQVNNMYEKIVNEVKAESKIDQNTQNSFNKIIKEFNKNIK
ncbi:MAG TPA: hypothetical protein QF753_10305 [Victivallales bacterium]|nr:hypothetical protein [Victivallales bacterium]